MNGVVAAQAVKLGELARGSRQGIIDANRAQLSVQVVDGAHCAVEGVCIDSSHPAGQRCRGPCLWVNELTGNELAGLVPQLFGEV